MKLYATVTSERGKKVSKGGNEYLNVNINVNNDMPGYSVNVFRNENTGKTEVQFIALESGKWLIKYSTVEFENVSPKQK